MTALLTSILKMIVLPEKLTPERLKVGNGEVNRFGIGRNSVEHTKRSEKSSKLRKSKREKMFKS